MDRVIASVAAAWFLFGCVPSGKDGSVEDATVEDATVEDAATGMDATDGEIDAGIPPDTGTIDSAVSDATSPWPVQIGGSGAASVFDVDIDSDDNLFLAGCYSGTGRFGENEITSANSANAYLAQVNANGEVVWVREGRGERVEAYAVTVAADGYATMAGNFHDGTASFENTDITAGNYDLFAARYHPDGTLSWAVALGGNAVEVVHGVAAGTDGHVYLVGRFDGEVTFGNETLTPRGDADCYVVKLDRTDGHVLWARRFGGDESDACYAATGHGTGIVASGFFRGQADFGSETLTSEGENDGFVVQIDGTGTVNWATPIGTGDDNTWAQRAVIGSNDSILLEGLFAGQASFGNEDLTATGRHDLFVAQLNASGVVEWATTAGGSGEARSSGIARASDGSIYLTGDFFDATTFGTSTITPVNNQGDLFVAKLSPTGEASWAVSAGGASTDRGADLVVNSSGLLLVVGDFQQTATFGDVELTAEGSVDGVIWRVTPP